MANRYLLNHIKKLEQEIEEMSIKEDKLKKISLNLKKLCQPILEVNMLKNDVKVKIERYVNFLIQNLETKDISHLYDKNGFLQENMFFNIIEKIDLSEYLLFVFKLRDSKELSVASSFIESKWTPFLSVNGNKIIGLIPKEKLKDFENTRIIPFFANNQYEELKFFVVFFESSVLNFSLLHKAMNIFDRFYLKPSFSDKSFVHYSLDDNKIIDFEVREKEKIKKEYAYINELKYPELENLIRKEIRNVQFVLALLDRIDSEIEFIKQSKGTIIVVKRILSFIHRNQIEQTIQEMTELISQEIEIN